MQNIFVDVILDGVHDNPQCFHGPTLLFRKRGSTKEEYFACSACRNRRQCSFFLKKTDIEHNKQSERAISERRIATSKFNSEAFIKLRRKLKAIDPEERKFCQNCSVLFVVSDDINHMSCVTISGLSNRQLTHPTEICVPKENNKVEAQYLFSVQTTNEVIRMLKNMNLQRALCIGTPKLHENILELNDLGIRSLLLDLDSKYHYFYSKKKFLWYNMFNNFIMDENKINILSSFLKTRQEIILLMDPPFGGRVEPIAVTLSKLTEEYNRINSLNQRELKVIWFFPYYMERHIRDSLPSFRMLDYQVNYENHASFSDKGHRRRKAGSPVRIFTNIPLGHFSLKDIPGYKYCNICQYWVSVINVHCKDCDACTSKNGTSYVHCHKCGKCRKPSYSHCETCRRCCLPTHKCGEFQPDNTCYHCHEPGHKKVACPNLQVKLSAKRRKKQKP